MLLCYEMSVFFSLVDLRKRSLSAVLLVGRPVQSVDRYVEAGYASGTKVLSLD